MAGSTVTPPPEGGRTWAVSGDDSLEEIVGHVPLDLVLAEELPAGGSERDSIDGLEHDFWADPCRFLRRACQDADYGATRPIPESAETGCGPR